MLDEGPSARFAVRAEPGGYDLGSWSKVEGLAVSWDVAAYRSGQGSRRRYSRVKLARKAAAESTAVQAWLSEISLNQQTSQVTVELYGDEVSRSPILSWELKDAVPVKWSIEAFSPHRSKAALETLEIDHVGFLP